MKYVCKKNKYISFHDTDSLSNIILEALCRATTNFWRAILSILKHINSTEINLAIYKIK
jgi:hypothetical protein